MFDYSVFSKEIQQAQDKGLYDQNTGKPPGIMAGNFW